MALCMVWVPYGFLELECEAFFVQERKNLPATLKFSFLFNHSNRVFVACCILFYLVNHFPRKLFLKNDDAWLYASVLRTEVLSLVVCKLGIPQLTRSSFQHPNTIVTRRLRYTALWFPWKFQWKVCSMRFAFLIYLKGDAKKMSQKL